MEQEHPGSMTARAVKKALPERAIVTKDARVMINTATSMFTLYLSTIAHDISTKNKRSTITLKDVLAALKETDFEHFVGPVEQCLQDTKAADARKRARKEAQKSGSGVDIGVEDSIVEREQDAVPNAVPDEGEEAPLETDADLEGEQTIDEDDEADEEEDQLEEESAEEEILIAVEASIAVVEPSQPISVDAAALQSTPEDVAMEESRDTDN